MVRWNDWILGIKRRHAVRRYLRVNWGVIYCMHEGTCEIDYSALQGQRKFAIKDMGFIFGYSAKRDWVNCREEGKRRKRTSWWSI